MKRMKKHKIKHEMPETSTSYTRETQDHDLAYYIHDRVELVHQIFSIIKAKDIRAMAPDSVRHISIDNLQELCTEELLGISSKRLCAILDGAEPPSDTESSSASPEPFETISLDSISSDEEILSQSSSKKKKHKHRRRNSKSKSKKKKSRESPSEDVEKSKASRAGLTVLELLELQARARAIRAQLQQEHINKPATEKEAPHSSSSDGEVEIKEEPAEVLIISSSDDEKPDVKQLQKVIALKQQETTTNEPSKQAKKDKMKEKGKKGKDDNKEKDKRKDSTYNIIEPGVSNESSQKITKRINDLVITVPQQSTRKIKLNRSKVTVSVSNESNAEPNQAVTVTENDENSKVTSTVTVVDKFSTEYALKDTIAEKDNKDKTRKKKRKKRITKDKDSDHDEITLQLSDSEKMDLLEDLDRKNFDVVSSSSSEDTDSSLDAEIDSNNFKKEETDTTIDNKDTSIDITDSVGEDKKVHQEQKLPDNLNSIKDNDESLKDTEENNKKDSESTIVEIEKPETMTETVISPKESIEVENVNTDNHNKNPKNGTETTGYISENINENVLEIQNIDDIPIQSNEPITDVQENNVAETHSMESSKETEVQKNINNNKVEEVEESNSEIQATVKDLSDGELSDHESSEVEAIDLKPEIVCISDDEKQATKKKKKKDKKKKDKKSKKKDFRESADQNFYRESENLSKVNPEIVIEVTEMDNTEIAKIESINFIDDDVNEIFELSDGSSCYEVEGTVLSKEPTVEEIAALSAKIDEIEKEEREDIVTEEEILEFKRKQENLEENKEIENVSWKDRYLDSKKVKTVLCTSNILNALRKKNKELKKKLEDKNKEKEELRKKEKEKESEAKVEEVKDILEEGSIEQYNTLLGSAKYVDPVKEIEKNEANGGKEIEEDDERGVTGDMKKDAKQLLKMYKKLLKYNDMDKQKQKDPNRKKKKKSKKKDVSKEVAPV